MDRGHSRHHSDHFPGHAVVAPPPPSYPQGSRSDYGHPQMHSHPHPHDPLNYSRDRFSVQKSGERDEHTHGARTWTNTHSHGIPPLSSHPPSSSIAPSPSFLVPHPSSSLTTTNVSNPSMSLPYDPSRRRSIGAATSPPQFAAGMSHHTWAAYSGSPRPAPPESPSALSSYAPRAMPPPSPPQLPPSAPHNSAPYGPPTASPFSGIRDLANLSSTRRTGNGMSISSMLGGFDERKSDMMRPPSPGRARASSMREPYTNGFRDRSPRRDFLFESGSAVDHERPRDGRYDFVGERPSANTFRAFETTQNGSHSAAGGVPGRPSSQPLGFAAQEKFHQRGDESARLGSFKPFAATEPTIWNASQPADRSAFSSPGANKEVRDVFSPAYSNKQFNAPVDQAPLFRPAYPTQGLPLAHESIEAVTQREGGRATPPVRPAYRNGASERPLTFEEHQRVEAAAMQRKDSDGSVPRSLFNLSPELRRRGRDSPLPQAVQGAQPRHIGPGGDHPSIKSEFGRMFSGLGSGVGSATPVAGQSMNGGTPTRIISPTRADGADFTRGSFEEMDEPRSVSARPARKALGRRPRDDMEAERYDGRMTPSLSQRGSKRAKTVHPLHHHHHHHHHAHHHHRDVAEQAGSYGMIRFPSNPLLQTQAPHRHHHHHHATHAHPAQHQHNVRPSGPQLRKPDVSIHSEAVLASVSGKPRKHLGSMPYHASASMPTGRARSDTYLRYSVASDIIPRFDGKENCTFTVRVPRWYLSQAAGEINPLEEVCRRRQLWGSDIYTDDSDVVAAAVHSGWLLGNFGDSTADIAMLDERDSLQASHGHKLEKKPTTPVKIPANLDVHITILIIPPLESYGSTHANHILSREWKGAEPHDGMSFMVHKIEFVDEGQADRGAGRDASSRKARIAFEERRRNEAAAALMMLPGVNGTTHSVSVGA